MMASRSGLGERLVINQHHSSSSTSLSNPNAIVKPISNCDSQSSVDSERLVSLENLEGLRPRRSLAHRVPPPMASRPKSTQASPPRASPLHLT